MDQTDPHIHVDVDLHADVSVRTLMVTTFGLVGDLPTEAGTGCGRRVPYVMTSTRPGNVTCLPCREYAQRRYLELADYVRAIGQSPGTAADLREQAVRAGGQYLDLARQFAGPQS